MLLKIYKEMFLFEEIIFWKVVDKNLVMKLYFNENWMNWDKCEWNGKNICGIKR